MTFKTVVLEHEDMIHIVFEVISVTNETSYVPRTNESLYVPRTNREHEEHEAGDGDGDSERLEVSGTPYQMLTKGQLKDWMTWLIKNCMKLGFCLISRIA